MNPEEALRRQIERYRAMTGEERLQIALDLHAFACEVAREGIRHQCPQATEAEIEEHLRWRIALARSDRLALGMPSLRADILPQDRSPPEGTSFTDTPPSPWL